MAEQHDPFDATLRNRIGAAETRVRVSSTPPTRMPAGPGPARWLSPVLVLATAAAAVLLAVFVIGQVPDGSTGDATPSPPAMEGVSASARNGDFVLTLSSPRATWKTGDAILISAMLSYDGTLPEVEIGGGGVPVVFSLVQLEGGNAVLGGGQDLPCLRYPLGPDAPLNWPFVKSGVVHADPPFDLAFFQEPELRLPPGRWEARAVLDYGIGDCGDLQLAASIQIEVRDDGVLPSPSARACPAALIAGVLAATEDGAPLLIVGDDVPPITIVWSYPEDYRIVTTPVLVVYDLDGNELAREGDWVELSGGSGADDTVFHVCGHISRQPAPSAGEAATVQLSGTWATCCYIEGARTYVSFAGPTSMEDRLFEAEDRIVLLPGHYSMTLYHRPCSVNCDFGLMSPRGHCTTEFDVLAGEEIRATIVWRLDGPCEVTISK
jgi:hypothetical protein